MAAEFTLAIVAPDREVLDQAASSVILPGVQGYFGVLAGHEPVVFALKEGNIEFSESGGAKRTIAISGGFAEVTGSKVTVLADSVQL